MLQASFLGFSSKFSLFDSLVHPIVLYGSMVWIPSLIAFDWAFIEQVQTLLLRRIIRCHRFTPHNIVLVEFGVHPLKLAIIFYLIWFLHRLHGFMETCVDRHRYSFLAYCSSVEIMRSNTSARSRCWYA